MTTGFVPPSGPTVLPGGQVVQPSAGVLPSRAVQGATVEREDGQSGPQSAIEVPDAVIRVRNTAPVPFRQRFLREWYTIQPGNEAILPWDVFVAFFGDPALKNHGPNRKDREEAYKRIRFKYGSLEDNELWEQNRPRVECYRMNGEKIVPLCDDPEGTNVHQSAMTVAGMDALQSQIAYLQQQVAAMNAAGQVTAPDHQIGPPIQPAPPVDPDQEAVEDAPKGRRPSTRRA